MTVWRELLQLPARLPRRLSIPYLYDDGFPIRRIAPSPAPKVPRAAETL